MFGGAVSDTIQRSIEPLQILIIILVASLFAFEDAALRHWFSAGWDPDWPDGVRWLVALSGFGIVVLGAFLFQWRTKRRLQRKGDRKAIIFSERITSLALGTLVAIQIANLALLDWLGLIRSWVGNLVFIDEFLALLPVLFSIMLVWAAQYPINRLVREATLIRQLDLGMPIYPIWRRSQFVLLQVRLHFVLILLPILLVISWRELIDQLAVSEGWFGEVLAGDAAQIVALAAGTVVVFLLAPFLIRYLWDTQPLPAGEIRNRLLEMCTTHRIKIRELLVWNTFSVMMNGAVMGVVGRMRYILLTDALLDAMAPRQIESVMAHELGHVRRRHLPALILALFAILIFVSMAVSLPMTYFYPPDELAATLAQSQSASGVGTEIPMGWLEAVAFIISILGIFLLFGWVSRRFERQADTFAVQHLSGMTRTDLALPMTAEAVVAMSSALGLVAALNSIPVKKRSWRHGSIAWRQNYLRTLVGRSCKGLAIDRTVFLIKIISLLIVVAFFSYYLWEELL